MEEASHRGQCRSSGAGLASKEPATMTRRILMSVLLLLVLSVSPVRAEEHESSLVDLLSQAWGGLVSFWMENGCILDPSGGCATGQTEITLPQSQDNGCILDPDGRCRVGN
jgi:hypothetical protein